MNIISALPSFLYTSRERGSREPSKLPSASHLCRVATAANPTPSLSLLLPLEGGNRSEAETGGSPSRSLAASLAARFPCCASLRNYAPFYSLSPKWPRRDRERRGREGRKGGLRDTPGRLAVVAEIETAEEEERNFSDFPTVNVYYPPSSSLSRACPPCVCLRMSQCFAP